MNLNHIAKKPFLDAFYKKPHMGHLLRAALFDCGSAGPRGALRFDSQIASSNNAQIELAMKIIKDVSVKGNHITAMLSMNDLI